jgi:hypothetical protein
MPVADPIVALVTAVKRGRAVAILPVFAETVSMGLDRAPRALKDKSGSPADSCRGFRCI